MFKNYIKSAFRFLKRNKLFAGINILGLSLALAASFIILLYIINELSYNNCYNNRKQIFRVVSYWTEFKNTQAGTPFNMAQTLKDEFPSIEHAISTISPPGFKLKLKDEFIKSSAVSTNSEIFDIFGFALEGNQKDILTDPNSIVLSRKQADIFFPNENAIGKEIVGFVNNEEQVFIVKGIFDDIPINSTIKADVLINNKWGLEWLQNAFGMPNLAENWHINFWTTWIMTKPGTDIATFDSRFRSLETKYLGEKAPYNYSLQNLSDIYLHSENIANTVFVGNLKNIKIFSTIAFLIVLVAAFNYIILSTAISTSRTKEIGIRKTNGATSRLIGRQLLNESIFLAIIVLPLALVLARIFMPHAETLFQVKLHIIPSNILVYILMYLGLTLLIGIISGLYTSSYLSRLNVIQILKNNLSSGQRKPVLRYSLIIVQLIIFCSFVSSTLIIRSQYKFALQKDPGYQTEDILILKTGRNFKEYASFINTIRSFPEIDMAAGTMHALPMTGTMSSMHEHFEDNTKKIKVEGMAVDFSLLETLDITLLDGRFFSTDFGSDLTGSVILNETAVEQLGISDPIGKKINNYTIIGVVKDFNLHSIHTDIPPLMISMTDRYINSIIAKYKPGTLNNILPKIENEWKALAPGSPFQYQTIEELTKSVYSSEKNLNTIISIFSVFTLLISALGLFGLTLFVAKTQIKQIGIKKVLGCSSESIISSFLRENFILVGIATILSIPITFYFMNKWLSNFAFKTEVQWWTFAIAFVVSTFVVLFTVFIQSSRASRVNPVDALRYE